MATVFVGTIIHSLSLEELASDPSAALGVGADGRVLFLEPAARLAELQQTWGFSESAIVRLKESQFVIPGFIDTHTHAPQYVFTGTGMSLTLLEWLEKITFPREACFSEPEYAQHVYTKVVRRHLRAGSTTCCYYGTIHLPATKILVDIIEGHGQRAFVGKVNMDRHAPQSLTEAAEGSLRDTEAFVQYVLAKQRPTQLVPVITPRFAPSCTPELLRGLGELAERYQVPIQSHLSENTNEIAWVAELFPSIADYTSVYKAFGLLNSRTIMAHAIHLSASERDLIRTSGTAISHCPSSNFSLSSGILNVRRLLREGITVGLGSDVAGGYSPSILDALRHAILASKVINMSDSQYPSLSVAEAFYLATLGGAQAVGLGDEIGNFLVGKQFDALLVDVDAGGHVDSFDHDDHDTRLEKFLYLGDDRNIVRIFVAGRDVTLSDE